MALKYRLSLVLLAAVPLVFSCVKREAAAPPPARQASQKLPQNAAAMALSAHVAAPAGMTPILVNVIALATKDQSDLFESNVLIPVRDFEEPFADLPAGALKFDVKVLTVAEEQEKLGLHPKTDPCYFDIDDPDHFYDRLDAARQSLSMQPAKMTIVMMHVDPSVMVVGACAIGNNLVLASDQVDQHALAHEFGHAWGALRHEFDGNAKVVASAYHEPNCSASATSLPWTVASTTQPPIAGCDESVGLYHAMPACRMATPSSDFCCVCTEYMLRHLSDMLSVPLARPASMPCSVPPALLSAVHTPPAPGGALVTADFYSADRSRIVSFSSVPFIATKPSLIAGDFFATVSSNGKVLEATGLPNDPSMVRAYPPGHDSVDHLVQAQIPTRLVFIVPRVPGTEPYEGNVINLPGLSGKAVLNDAVRSQLSAHLPP